MLRVSSHDHVRCFYVLADSVFDIFFFLMLRRPPRSTLFPYTSSSDLEPDEHVEVHARHRALGSLDRPADPGNQALGVDRKSTRLNSSHANISYAVFCLKKKIKKQRPARRCVHLEQHQKHHHHELTVVI